MPLYRKRKVSYVQITKDLFDKCKQHVEDWEKYWVNTEKEKLVEAVLLDNPEDITRGRYSIEAMRSAHNHMKQILDMLIPHINWDSDKSTTTGGTDNG